MGRAADAVIGLLLAGTLLAGCGSSREARGRGEEEEAMRRAEREFRPSDYDPAPGAALHPEKAPGGDTVTVDLPETPAVPPELVAGFRVQIFSSTDIDEATAMKDTAEAHFPAEWFYLVYEPPTYKVRAGDLLTRHEADRLARLLRDAGYDDSWVVPDRVYRTPPLKRPPAEG